MARTNYSEGNDPGATGSKGRGGRSIRRGRSRSARRLSVRSQLRQEPDVRRIARAVIDLALAQAEADAAAADQRQREQTAEEDR